MLENFQLLQLFNLHLHTSQTEGFSLYSLETRKIVLKAALHLYRAGIVQREEDQTKLPARAADNYSMKTSLKSCLHHWKHQLLTHPECTLCKRHPLMPSASPTATHLLYYSMGEMQSQIFTRFLNQNVRFLWDLKECWFPLTSNESVCGKSLCSMLHLNASQRLWIKADTI